MNLTKKQTEALVASFKKGGAVYGRRGNLMGGAYTRMCHRLVEMGLVGENPPHAITVKGLVVLRDLWARRWGKQGCMAYLEDLRSVEAALATVPDLAKRAEERLSA